MEVKKGSNWRNADRGIGMELRQNVQRIGLSETHSIMLSVRLTFMSLNTLVHPQILFLQHVTRRKIDLK